MPHTVLAPPIIQGDIKLPASKSISNRALILNAMATENSTKAALYLNNLAECDDTTVMSKALSSNSNQIDIGAAGTSMRFLTAYFAGMDGEWFITGSERMKNRPIRVLVDALRTLGATIDYTEKEGYPPLRIQGHKLKGGSIEVDGGISSQYISALMMAAPLMEEGLDLRIKGELISKPYFRMTLAMMKAWGAEAQWDYHRVQIKPQTYKPMDYTVESDWSAASYWYEILSLAEGGEIFLQGLYEESLQGDIRIAEWFDTLGIHSSFEPKGVRLTQIPVAIERFDADLSDQPDLAQTLAVTCILKNIPFCMTGLQSLKIKETDRLKALIDESAKLGFLLTSRQDSILEWTGEKSSMYAAPIDTYDDHRMAMAFAPVAVAYGIVRINDPEVVSKSYPTFWNDLQKCGFQLDK
jgi:3-phosphoshikimate 1-carboxyvinyltransferase